MKFYSIFLLILWFAPIAAAQSVVTDWTETITKATQSGLLAPVLSVNQTIDIKTAYRVQTEVVGQRLGSDQPAGFKAGLTSSAGQKAFGVTQPVAGVLLADGELQTRLVKLNQYHVAMLEMEVGFRFNTVIDQPVSDIAVLKNSVDLVLPVIELPDLGFDNRPKLQGVDIIANNVAVKQYMVGKPQRPENINLSSLTVSLSRNGQAIMQGAAADAMGNQWQALQWLVNRSLASGWRIEPGQLLITGAMGKMIPAKAGRYLADFGALGSIRFTVE